MLRHIFLKQSAVACSMDFRLTFNRQIRNALYAVSLPCFSRIFHDNKKATRRKFHDRRAFVQISRCHGTSDRAIHSFSTRITIHERLPAWGAINTRRVSPIRAISPTTRGRRQAIFGALTACTTGESRLRALDVIDSRKNTKHIYRDFIYRSLVRRKRLNLCTLSHRMFFQLGIP